MNTNRIHFDFPWRLHDTDFAGVGVMAPEDQKRAFVDVADENVLSVMQSFTESGFNPSHEVLS